MLVSLLGIPQLTMIFIGFSIVFGLAGIFTGLQENDIRYVWGGLICSVIWMIL